MYTPPDAVASTQVKEIIAIVGAPGSGKSLSCLTFPNRLWYDYDHKVPVGEISVPCWDANWVDKMHLKKQFPSDPANYRDAIRKNHRDNLAKFSPEQTIIEDSWTQLVEMAGRQIRLDESRLDKANKFFYYGELLKYCKEVSGYLKEAPCRVVSTFHETPEWIEGESTGKLKPVQEGQFKDQLFAIYTDVFRMVNGIRKTVKDAGGIIKSGIIEGRYWQVQGDASFDTNANSTLSPLLRKYGIKYIPIIIRPDNTIAGGFEAIQKIYREDSLVVSDGILKVN